jgi:predicted ATPase
LREALGLWRGPALSEFVYDEIAQGAIARLEEERASVLEDRVEADLACGRHGELVAELEAAVAAEPLRERLRGQLMVALYRSGRQADALRQFQEARRVLSDQLGLDPGSELRRLEAAILAQDTALDGPPAVPAAPAATHGEPRRDRLGNLTVSLNRFIGRQGEFARLSELLASSRLVTLVGPGGAGKSRLALEVAASLAPGFADGAWIVELAPIGDAASVLPAIGSTLGIVEVGESRPRVAWSPIEAVMSYLDGRSLIMVLDNCEHLIDRVAEVAEALLQRVSGLRVLATSREALSVPGETLLPLGPLPPADAVALFVDRAQAVAPTGQAISDEREAAEDLCRRLDGMPLAIELAASRLRALPLAQLAARMDDRFRVLTGGARTALPRHQTLRAVVDWSYDLLFKDEQRLFRRISVFVGPFTAEDAEAVCADEDLPGLEVLDLLVRLVDKSLVLAASVEGHEARFTQLQTLWQYGREQLETFAEAEAVRARHAGYYTQMADDARLGLQGPSGPAWRERLSLEVANMRAALEWHISTDDADSALTLAIGMAFFWFIGGEFYEGNRWLGDALEVTGTASPSKQALACAWHGHFTSIISSPAAGASECESAVSTLRTHGDEPSLAEALNLWAVTLLNNRDLPGSLRVLQEALELTERIGNQGLRALHDVTLGWIHAQVGRLDDAERAARSGLQYYESVGNAFLSIEPLNLLASLADARGDFTAAAAAYEDMLNLSSAGRPAYEPFTLIRLAALRARQGDDEAADALYQQVVSARRDLWLAADAMVGQAAVARRLGDLTRARTLLDAAARQYEMADLPARNAALFGGLTWWAIAAGEPEQAMAFAADAARAASAAAHPAAQLIADAAVAAARATTQPTRENTDAFLSLARERNAQSFAFGSFTDEADVASLAARLA